MRLSLGVVTFLIAGSVSVIVTSAPAAAAATASAASDAARAVSYAQA
ncbi:MAG: hypothetical protein QOI69_3052, partial [Pseudonocardiales bacterium]|nr:hypothetical protein [Pseudonocardiales bacterium]